MKAVIVLSGTLIALSLYDAVRAAGRIHCARCWRPFGIFPDSLCRRCFREDRRVSLTSPRWPRR